MRCERACADSCVCKSARDLRCCPCVLPLFSIFRANHCKCVSVRVCRIFLRALLHERTQKPQTMQWAFGRGNRFLSHSHQQETALTPTAPRFRLTHRHARTHVHTSAQKGEVQSRRPGVAIRRLFVQTTASIPFPEAAFVRKTQ